MSVTRVTMTTSLPAVNLIHVHITLASVLTFTFTPYPAMTFREQQVKDEGIRCLKNSHTLLHGSNTLSLCTIKYVSADVMMELWLKVMIFLKAHSSIVWPSTQKVCPPCTKLANGHPYKIWRIFFSFRK